MSTYTVRCSQCGTSNRIPAEKEGIIGRCGNCHRELPPLYYRPLQLTEYTFDTFIKGFVGPVLAEFWAPWCPHCRDLEPSVIRVAELLAGDAAVVQVNTDENPKLAGRFKVRGIPVFFLLRYGAIVDQFSGSRSSEDIAAWFRQHR